MKKILMFKMTGCPHCARAFRDMETLFNEKPAYRDIPLEIVDEVENPDYANQFDYYYVPTYYVDGKKMAEGVLSKEDIRAVFESAL